MLNSVSFGRAMALFQFSIFFFNIVFYKYFHNILYGTVSSVGTDQIAPEGICTVYIC